MDDGVVFVDKIHARRLAIRTVGQKAIVGVVKLPFKGIHLQIQRIALVNIAGLVDIDRAYGIDLVLGHGVVQLFRPDHAVATAQFRIAMHGSLDIGLTGQIVALDIDRLLVAHLLRVDILQQGAVLEFQRRQPILHRSCFGGLLGLWRLRSGFLGIGLHARASPGQGHSPGQWANRRPRNVRLLPSGKSCSLEFTHLGWGWHDDSGTEALLRRQRLTGKPRA